MHEELKADGVHAAGVTVRRDRPGHLAGPNRIADTYWTPHNQRVSEWTAETYFDGQ